MTHRQPLFYAPKATPPPIDSLLASNLSITCPPSPASEWLSGTFKPILRKLATIHASICRLRPHYILALRVALAFAISRLDFLYDAIPPPPVGLPSLQLAVNNLLTAALGVPRNFPKILLHAPLATGGFGVPHLARRFQLRYVTGVFQALNSRNALVRHIQAPPNTSVVQPQPPRFFKNHNKLLEIPTLESHSTSAGLPSPPDGCFSNRWPLPSRSTTSPPSATSCSNTN